MKRLIIPLLLTFGTPYANAIELIGQVSGLNKQSVVAEVNGVIDSAQHQIGHYVEMNQMLATIKDDDFELQASKEEANLALMTAKLKLREATYKRYQKLTQKQSLAVGELDLARSEYLSAKAELSVAKIQHQQANRDLLNTKIESKIAGYISSKSVQSGAWVNKGDLLYEMINIDEVSLIFMASEYDLAAFELGQRVVVWSETESKKKIEAQVSRIGMELESDNGSYPVVIEIDNLNRNFRPGMSVYVSTDLSLVADSSGKE
ncbi:efflux RND transporter periplasmic adaptor subunit [Vibrio caribbeanicus]|uniref:efflux RND transporter periplasmic adaptor subunit n=1 Tax=Vibrio caribbeanicus TaxID=701175 RepID=UPI0030DA9CB5